MRVLVALGVVGLLAAVPFASAGASGDARTTRFVFSAVAAYERPTFKRDQQIYSVEPNGAGLAQLTFEPEAASDPLPSPDGRWIAFIRLPSPNAPSIWVMRADGRGQRRLAARGHSPAWAPDSSALAYVHGGIREVRADGRGRRVLVPYREGRAAPSAPVWSPDGRALAYSRGGALRIRARHGRDRELLNWGFGVQRIAWSSDGRLLAVEGHERVSVVRANGRNLRTLGDGRMPAWAPRGARLAHVSRGDLIVTELPAGRMRTVVDARLTVYSFAWAPEGTAIAYVESPGVQAAGAIATVGLDGRIRSSARTPADLGGISWRRQPTGLRYRPPTPFTAVTPDEVRLLDRIDELAVDGDRVAYRSCGSLGVWRPGDTGVVAVRSEMPRCAGWPPIHYSLALAGDRVAWGTLAGGNSKRGLLGVAPIATDAERTIVSSPQPTTSGFPQGNARSGRAFGDGSLIVFSAWKFCGELRRCPDVLPAAQPIATETLWRVRETSWPGVCPLETSVEVPPGTPEGRCQNLRVEPGPLRSLDVDAGRIVVSGDNETLVLDDEGRVVASVPLSTHAAQLSSSTLVVAVRGRLSHYDAATGDLLGSRPLPDVPVGGPCGIDYCPAPGLRLEDLAHGQVAYVLDGRVHLLRLSDGADRTVAEGTTARFGDHGLFYAYEAPAPRRGRVRFVPFANLPA
jgi:Tol biopolymer transport system component